VKTQKNCFLNGSVVRDSNRAAVELDRMVSQVISQNQITKSQSYGLRGVMRSLSCFIAGFTFVTAMGLAEPPEGWPQFRGQSSSGLAVNQSPPTEFGLADNACRLNRSMQHKR
jgi:hypothetical protein